MTLTFTQSWLPNSVNFLNSIIRVAAISYLFLLQPVQLAAQQSHRQGVDNFRLPSGRTITPAGDSLDFYGRPVDMEIGADGNTLFVKDRSTVRAIDCETFQVIDSAGLKGGASLYGMACSDDGKIYVSNSKNQVHTFEFKNNELNLVRSIELPAGSFPCGLELSADQQELFICLSRKNSVAVVEIASGTITDEIPVGIAPLDCKRVNDRLWVSNMGGRQAKAGDQTALSANTKTVVDKRGIANNGTATVISLNQRKPITDVSVGLHPSVIESEQESVYVCNSNDDTISKIRFTDLSSKQINIKPNTELPFGSMPSCVKRLDEQHLLVTLAGNNAVAVLKTTANNDLNVIGHIPTAWYPASIAVSEKYVFIGNIKGYGSRTQRRKVEKGRNSHDHNGVVQRISRNDVLDPDKLKTWSKTVSANGRLPQILRNQMLSQSDENVAPKPIPDQLGNPSVFKHVVYVIKENRTFDQIFGDYPEARSDPNLCIFPRDKTPNHHALADRFGILDNYYCNGILSADGHSWATEGNVTTYLERAFGGFSRSYTFGNDPITYSSSGFIWDHVLAAGLSFRNYGEFDYAKPPNGMKYHEIYRRYKAGEKIEFQQNIGVERLRSYSCRNYPGWNMDIPDVLRMDRFLKEFNAFVANDDFPNMCIVYLPEDHLGAAGVTSNAHMADNDLAIGRLIEAISKSKYWKDTVIFINEDDPQNGFDHIDGHRSICLPISAYSKRGVNHNFYNQTSVLRTILHIFGLPPMNQQDASAPLMRECFGNVADMTPYQAITPQTKLNEKPGEQSQWSPAERKWRAALATVPIERTGMKNEQDEDNLNRFIWHEAKGWNIPYPTEFAGAHGKGLKSLGLALDPEQEDD